MKNTYTVTSSRLVTIAALGILIFGSACSRQVAPLAPGAAVTQRPPDNLTADLSGTSPGPLASCPGGTCSQPLIPQIAGGLPLSQVSANPRVVTIPVLGLAPPRAFDVTASSSQENGCADNQVYVNSAEYPLCVMTGHESGNEYVGCSTTQEGDSWRLTMGACVTAGQPAACHWMCYPAPLTGVAAAALPEPPPGASDTSRFALTLLDFTSPKTVSMSSPDSRTVSAVDYPLCSHDAGQTNGNPVACTAKLASGQWTLTQSSSDSPASCGWTCYPGAKAAPTPPGSPVPSGAVITIKSASLLDLAHPQKIHVERVGLECGSDHATAPQSIYPLCTVTGGENDADYVGFRLTASAGAWDLYLGSCAQPGLPANTEMSCYPGRLLGGR